MTVESLRSAVRLAPALLLLSLVVALDAHADNDTVVVKYRGAVNLAPFKCQWIHRSSFIERLCYDAKEQYVIVDLQGTYYHYCEVPAGVVSSWLDAPSMGRFYNTNIKGEFDCRIFRMPSYAGSDVRGAQRLQRIARPGYACEADHRIQTVSDDGDIVVLDDGSVWQVDDVDTANSSTWTPATDVVACINKLINIDENETVSAIRIR